MFNHYFLCGCYPASSAGRKPIRWDAEPGESSLGPPPTVSLSTLKVPWNSVKLPQALGCQHTWAETATIHTYARNTHTSHT